MFSLMSISRHNSLVIHHKHCNHIFPTSLFYVNRYKSLKFVSDEKRQQAVDMLRDLFEREKIEMRATAETSELATTSVDETSNKPSKTHRFHNLMDRKKDAQVLSEVDRYIQYTLPDYDDDGNIKLHSHTRHMI